MPVIEVVRFPASETYIANPAVFNEALDAMAMANGQIDTYHGIQEEDRSTGYLAVVWESLDSHKKLMQHSSYGSLKSSLQSALAGDLAIQHYDFAGEAKNALSAPVTEFALLTIKPMKPKGDVEKLLDAISRELDATRKTHFPTMWGPCIEDRGAFLMLVGWDTVQTHVETVKGDALKALITRVFELVDGQLSHVKLLKH